MSEQIEETVEQEKKRYSALLSADNSTASYIGAGYLSKQVPYGNAVIPGTACERYAANGYAAPCLVLDNGDVVWCEEVALVALSEDVDRIVNKATKVRNVKMSDVRRERLEIAKQKGRVQS